MSLHCIDGVRRVASQHIDGLGNRVKMLNANAGGSPTKMVENQSFRNRSNQEFIREAVRSDYAISNPEDAVTTGLPRTSPQPAFAGLIHLAPKALGRILLTIRAARTMLVEHGSIDLLCLEPETDPLAAPSILLEGD